MNLTLVNDGESVTLDFAGDGIVLETIGAETPIPHHFDTSQEAKEFIVRSAYGLLTLGWHIFTGETE